MAGESLEAAHAKDQRSDGSMPPGAEPVKPRRNDVKPHLRCPCCWNGYRGKARRRKWQRQVSGPLVQRCYVCDQCGAEWVVDVRVDEIDGVSWVETKTAKVRPGDVKP